MRLILLAIVFIFACVGLAISAGSVANTGDYVVPVEVKASSKPSVYILIFDEFSTSTLMNQKQKINRKRFPSFAKLARESTWYQNHTAASDTTPLAVPAMLSGHQPIGREFSYDNVKASVYSLLRPTHQMKIMDPISQLCQKPTCQQDAPPESSRARKLQVSAPSPRKDGYDVVEGSSATLQARQLAGMIESIKKTKRPQLWVSHTQMPHVPFTYLPNGDQYFNMGFRYPGMGKEDGNWSMDEALPRLSEQRNLLQTQFLDRMVGQFRAQLKAKKEWDNSMIIITADHGVSNWAGQPRRHVEEYNYADIANPPLFVKYPKQRKGRISEKATRQIDILPTIAKEVGVKAAVDWEGGLLEAQPAERRLQTNGRRRDGFVYQTVEEMVRQRQVTIEHNDQWFPFASPMISSALSRVKKSAISDSLANGMAISFDNPWQFKEVKYGSGWRTGIFATGYVEGVAPGSEILITANGEPAGIGSAFVDNNEMRFAMILSGLRAKDNQIKAYLRAGPSWLLIPEKDRDSIIETFKTSPYTQGP